MDFEKRGRSLILTDSKSQRNMDYRRLIILRYEYLEKFAWNVMFSSLQVNGMHVISI